MAKTDSKVTMFLRAVFCLWLIGMCNSLDARSDNKHVMYMQRLVNNRNVRIAETQHSIVTRSADNDIGSCQSKVDKYQQNLQTAKAQNTTFGNEFEFKNETRFSLALAWAKANSGNILVVTAGDNSLHDSKIYRSTNYGKTFESIQNKIGDNTVIRRDNGLQKHPMNADKIYIVTYSKEAVFGKSELYMTDDGGDSFSKSIVPFILDGNIVFHPNPDYQQYMMTYSMSDTTLYYSKDGGINWHKVATYVSSYKWATILSEQPDTIYYTADKQRDLFEMLMSTNINYNLTKATLNGDDISNRVIREHVISFGMEGNFLYVSVPDPNDQIYNRRMMYISKDGGVNWNEVQLPSIDFDRFFSILDMSEGMVFLHVDDKGDTGKGTLYISDGTGVVFSESLLNHLYPNFLDLTDFYKVESMKGVYLASQLADDKSIHTMITYNRGGSWSPIKNVQGGKCKDETKGCFLQIHNAYSISRSVPAQPPLSTDSAAGLILVHGHVADSLQTTEPDVFISSDGGYSWYKALDGPHYYEIVDQGGLLVAIAADTNTPNTIKFSTDEGRCWHSYKFTNKSIIFTKLLTEPGNAAMSVSVWGYTEDDHIWRVHTIDFSIVVPELCSDENDYDTFSPHIDNNKNGCLLGVKEKIQRLKPNSWCRNGHTKVIAKETETCVCTYEDYECDFGYFRKADSMKCEKDPRAKVNQFSVCLHGDRSDIITEGYRKVPGDQCKGGYEPVGEKLVIDGKCDNPVNFLSGEFNAVEGSSSSSQSNKTTVVLLGLVLTILLLMVIMMAFFIRKCQQLRGGRDRYRYSVLQQGENADLDMDQEVENSLRNGTSLYEDNDEQMQLHQERQGLLTTGGNHSTFNGTVPNGVPTSVAIISPTRGTDTNAPQPQPKVKSFHDDSDDDLLE